MWTSHSVSMEPVTEPSRGAMFSRVTHGWKEIAMRSLINIAAIAIFQALVGCAADSTLPATPGDPYESTNRQVLEFNQSVDRNVLKPVAVFYTHALPTPIRHGLRNVLFNLNRPVTFANDVLQGQAIPASQTLGGFAVNSTLGIGGFFDIAVDMDIPEHTEDFGATLALYGVGEGPYLVLPFIGPDNPRDAFGQVVDIFFDPVTYLNFAGAIYWSGGRASLCITDLRSRDIRSLDEVEASSVDLYAAIRSLYRQHRQFITRKGAPVVADLPNL
jgi:phospholipid-binding lipoprotein MlaA